MKWLAVTDTWINPRSAGSHARVAQIFEWLLAAGHQVCCLPLLAAPDRANRYLKELAQTSPRFSLAPPFYPARKIPGQFDALYLGNLWAPETLRLGLELARELGSLGHAAPLVYDAMDCLFKGVAQYHAPADRALLLAAEQELHDLASGSVFISAREQQDAIQALGLVAARTHVVTQAFTFQPALAARPHSERQHLCFVGAVHPSNLEGLGWFIRDVFPRVLQQRPELELHILGAGTDQLRLDCAQGLAQHIHLTGYVEDIEPAVSRYRLQVVPILRGSGIRSKLLQSLACGTPVVSTSKGAEGLAFGEVLSQAVSDSAQGFASALLDAYDDALHWQQLQTAGVRLVRTHHSSQVVDAQLHQLLRSLGL